MYLRLILCWCGVAGAIHGQALEGVSLSLFFRLPDFLNGYTLRFAGFIRTHVDTRLIRAMGIVVTCAGSVYTAIYCPQQSVVFVGPFSSPRHPPRTSHSYHYNTYVGREGQGSSSTRAEAAGRNG